LTIKPGEVVGFLGATGSGKSTLVNLIPRFYDVKSGKITIGGVDIREMPLKTLHQMVGVCLQESYLFSGTIQDNLVMGAQDTSYDAMVQAAQAADAHEFVSAIPEKYEGHVARKGADFSGGQRQRLSIARTLMLKPKILILDDSTSACDVATEARIQDAVRDLMKDVTQLIVAQRISSVITADKIVLMEKGEIIDIGTHEDLLESSKLYQEIYVSQLGGEVPEYEVVE
ncbi:MAG: ATP-binding cassette domain-containing protein, partial [Methanobacterium sp.]|nr:ATP-binding cassette domain-containing protein [Methanobacterium sp.]